MLLRCKTDTLVPDPASSQAFNRYSYVAGNPLVYVDPSGHYWVENEEQEGPTGRFRSEMRESSNRYPGKLMDTGFVFSNGPRLIKSGVSVAFCTIFSQPYGVEDSVNTGQYGDDALPITGLDLLGVIDSLLEPWANGLYMEEMEPNVRLELEYDLYDTYTIPKNLTVENLSNEPIWLRSFEMRVQSEGLEVRDVWVLGAKLSDVSVSPGQKETFVLNNELHIYPYNANLMDYYAELDMLVDLGILNTQWRIINNDLVAIGGIQCEGQ